METPTARCAQSTRWLLILSLTVFPQGCSADHATQKAGEGSAGTRGADQGEEILTGEGVVAFIDPVTGELVEPTPEQLEELERLRTLERNAQPPKSEAPSGKAQASRNPRAEAPSPNGGFQVDVPESLHPHGEIEPLGEIGPDGAAAVQDSAPPGGLAGLVSNSALGPDGSAAEKNSPPPGDSEAVSPHSELGPDGTSVNQGSAQPGVSSVLGPDAVDPRDDESAKSDQAASDSKSGDKERSPQKQPPPPND